MMAKDMVAKNYLKTSAPFLIRLAGWEAGLKQLSLSEIVAGEPDSLALICVDLLVGFCYQGPLASPRRR